MNKTALETLNDMCMEKEAAGWGSALLSAGKSIMNSGTMKNLSGTVKSFAKSPLGQSTFNGLKQGAMIGGINGALNPGTDKNGNQQSRLTSAIKGTVGGGAAGAGIGAASFGIPKAYNTVKNSWPTKTASEILDDMVDKVAFLRAPYNVEAYNKANDEMDELLHNFREVMKRSKGAAIIPDFPNVAKNKKTQSSEHNKPKVARPQVAVAVAPAPAPPVPPTPPPSGPQKNFKNPKNLKNKYVPLSVLAGSALAAGALAGGIKMLKKKKAEDENTEKAASEILDDMCMEKQANAGMVMGGIFSGIGKATKVFGKSKYRNLSTLAKLGKIGKSAVIGATVGGTVEGVANHLSNSSQGMPQQQDYPGKQNLNG